MINRNSIVNTNSKYKEDDFTDSDAGDYFQDMWIYFRPHVTLAPSLPLHPSTYPSPSFRLKHWRWSQLRLREQPWLLHGGDADT